METYLISLNVVTSSLSLAELSGRLGLEAAYGSHDKGSPSVGRKRPLASTLWRLNSVAPERAQLEEHLQSIWERLPDVLLTKREILPADCEVYLDVAMYYPDDKALLPAFHIGSAWVKALSEAGAGVELTPYPILEGKDKG